MHTHQGIKGTGSAKIVLNRDCYKTRTADGASQTETLLRPTKAHQPEKSTNPEARDQPPPAPDNNANSRRNPDKGKLNPLLYRRKSMRFENPLKKYLKRLYCINSTETSPFLHARLGLYLFVVLC